MYTEKDEKENKVKNKILTILSYEGFTLVSARILFDKIIEGIKENNKINL